MNGTYGIVRPSVIDIENDVEIWYHYRPTRNSTDSTFQKFKKADSVTAWLSESEMEDDTDGLSGLNILQGMYNLSLPASIFSEVGFYTIYIKPKEVFCKIKDIGALSAYPDINGIVIDMDDVDNSSFFSTDNLVGYRIEYFETSEGKSTRLPYYRIITSNNLCEPMSQSLTSVNTNANGYRFNDSASLCFLTVTPSTSPSFKASTKPFIGTPNQQISITNTKFDPVCVEVEICKVDFDTINTTLNGNQIRSCDNGMLTTYNENGEIFSQFDYPIVKNTYTQNEMYQARVSREGNIDNSIDYESIISQ